MIFQYAGYSGSGLFQTLVDWGLVDALLPFLLIFVLMFAILQKIALFKDDEGQPDRKINGILGMVIGAMVVIPHIVGLYPIDSDPIIMILSILPSTAVIALVVLCTLILLGLGGSGFPSWATGVVGFIAAGLLILVMLMTIIPGFFPVFDILNNPEIQALVIVLLVMGLVGYFVISGPSKKGFGETVHEWLQGR